MAEQLLLVKTYDFEADQDSVSLLNRTDGFEPAYGGWTPNVTASKKGFVSDAITVRVQGTSTDHIASNLQKLADKAEEVQRYIANGARDYAVWFRVQMYGETKGRQTLVQELRHEPASSVYDVGLRSAYHWNQYTIGIDHAPWWEGTACGTVTASTVNTCGGTFSYGTIAGGLLGRIAQIALTNTAAGTIWPNGKSWLGFKSNRYGSVTSFRPYWSFGTALSHTNGYASYEEADSTTLGGTRAVFDNLGSPIPTGAQYFARMITIGDGIGTAQYMRGDYLILLRARIPGTAEYLMQMKTGWADDYYLSDVGDPDSRIWPNAKSYPRVSIAGTGDASGTAWHFYEMGNISIPPNVALKNQMNMSQFSLMFFGERLSGTILYLDGIVFVPTDGFVRGGATYTNVTAGGTTHKMIAINSPDNRTEAVITGSAYYYGGTSYISSVAANTPDFIGGLDPGYNGVGVLVAEKLSGSSITDTLNVEIKYFERWKEIRGND